MRNEQQTAMHCTLKIWNLYDTIAMQNEEKERKNRTKKNHLKCHIDFHKQKHCAPSEYVCVFLYQIRRPNRKGRNIKRLKIATKRAKQTLIIINWHCICTIRNIKVCARGICTGTGTLYILYILEMCL